MDLISALNWRDGLTIEAVNLIKSHLSVDDSSTVSGAGGRRRSIEEQSAAAPSLVSLSAARHAAEVVGVVCGFVVGMVRYTAVYQTHMLAVEKLRRYVHIVT